MFRLSRLFSHLSSSQSPRSLVKDSVPSSTIPPASCISRMSALSNSEETAAVPRPKRARIAVTETDYEREIQAWRATREVDLRSKDGWLSVVGLHWLLSDVREHVLGSDSSQATIVLPHCPEVLGKLYREDDDKVSFELFAGVAAPVLVDGSALESGVRRRLLDDRGTQKPTEVRVGSSVLFYLIRRAPHGIGLRVKDSESEAIRSFRGRDWFPVDPKWRITAKWLENPSKIMIADVLGGEAEKDSPGVAEFDFGGVHSSLRPTVEGEKLEFVFRDKTSGKETYGACRFLYTGKPTAEGTLLMDFNKAFNPPCVFTEFATCPLPPMANRLRNIAINAGEKLPIGYEKQR